MSSDYTYDEFENSVVTPTDRDDPAWMRRIKDKTDSIAGLTLSQIEFD